MFLWVRLVVHELKHCYCDAEMENTATNLPKGLKAAQESPAIIIVSFTNSLLGMDVSSTESWTPTVPETLHLWLFESLDGWPVLTEH